MIEHKSGNILHGEAEALVNSVNCVGVMGRGLALQFKKAFPDNFKAYEKACKHGDVKPGGMFVFETGQMMPRFIINFPTKRHWRGASRMADIDAGLRDLVRVVKKRKIRSIAIPPLACGLGGLDWAAVRPRIEKRLQPLDGVRVVLYSPDGRPADNKPVRNLKVPNMTPGRAALVVLMHRYLGGLLDPFVTLLEIHKLMYFLQCCGEPLKLKYEEAHLGPYADNLRHVLNAIEGHLVSGYADGGDKPDKQIDLVPGAVEDASKFLDRAKCSDTRGRIDRVMKLVDGFESPMCLELLATVHWIMRHDPAPESKSDVEKRFYAWSTSKQRFTPRQIGICIDTLTSQSWVDALPDTQ